LLPPDGKGRSRSDIGKGLGVSKYAVGYWINRYGLGLQQDPKKRLRFFASQPRITPPSRERLIEQYIQEDKSVRELAKEMGYSTLTVNKWLRIYNIKKSPEQLGNKHSRRMSGKGNPAYTNGNSQHFVKSALSKVKPKVCEWCKTTKRVQVHHMDHNRENNNLENLTWLCGSCNRLEAQLRALVKDNRIKMEHNENMLTIEFLVHNRINH
jgi:transposase-like protein